MGVQEKNKQQEQVMVRQFILTHADLAGEDPSGWNLKGIQEYYKGIIKNKSDSIKKQKQKEDLEGARLRNKNLRDKNKNPFAAPAAPAKAGIKTAKDVLNKWI
jgi:uncharacterized protein YjbI with pentapeptide repeats